MPDLAIGFAVGLFALPWIWMVAFTCLFLADVILCEADEFAWGTTLLIVGTAAFSWLGAGINPFTWAWHNLGDLSLFFLTYFVIGGLWSVAKWYFFLLKLRNQLKEDITSWESRKAHWDETQKKATGAATLPRLDDRPRRPERSFAINSKGRIMGWIGHWPFSMLGVLFGDFLTKIVKSIYNALSSLYDRVSNSMFAGFDE